MSNLNNVQRRLAEGTSSWLMFEFHCKRGDLFSEKYLTVPVGQILTGLFPGQIKSEINHPNLQTGNAGRPPQLDFIVLNGAKWEVVVETKWVGKSVISIDQIIWDLMRLEILAREKNLTCYFILSGFSKKIVPIIENTHFSKNAPVTPVVTRAKNTKIYIDLQNQAQIVKNLLNSRMQKYPAAFFSEVISCDYPHFYPDATINMSFQTYVWKINPYLKARRINSL